MAIGRPTNLTYQTVSDACQALLAAGERPTVRKLCERLGGSFSTLSGFLQQWQEQQALANKADLDISPGLRQAILAEFHRLTQTIGKTLTEQIESKNGSLQEAQSLLAQQEAKLETLTERMAVQQAQAEQSRLEFEKTLSAANALAENSAQREAQMLQQLEDWRTEAHAAALKAASLEARCQELVKQNQKLEQEVTELRK